MSDPVVVLYRGGRLPSWHHATDAERDAAQRHHVDLMLDVGRRHGLVRIEGYRLLAPQGDWERCRVGCGVRAPWPVPLNLTEQRLWRLFCSFSDSRKGT